MPNAIILEISEQIATVSLNRPDKLNALDVGLITDLVDAGHELQSRKGIRAVILTGVGKAFSAGLDVAAMPELAAMVAKDGGIMRRTHGDANLFQAVSTIWSDLPMPVIAAVDGYAFGGGFQIMLGADMRVAGPGAKFSIMEAKWGLVPDMGGLVTMQKLARADVIRRLTYTAEVFGADAALNWGFITEIAPDPLARAQALAGEIAARSPDAMRAAKALIRECDGLDRAGILLAESRAQGALIGTANQMEAMMSGFEKRPPRFKD